MNISIRVHYEPHVNAIAVWMHGPDATPMAPHPLKLEPGEWTPPFSKLSEEQAQTLMDDLWHVGIRPTEGKGSAGQLSAVQAHLSDMRALAFYKIGTHLPEKAPK
jgi:hypothetical protein